jgi:glucose-1-phosphate cytidylyltransferase
MEEKLQSQNKSNGMKVVILCGGEGTRMKEETEFKPKPLVLVGGKPVLWHIMKIYSHYGYNEFILALGYKGDMIKEYFMNWRTLANDFTIHTKDQSLEFHNKNHDDFKITFVETGLKSLTGERLRQVASYIDGNEFMLTYGDGVADIDIAKLVEFHKKEGSVGTITGVRPLTKYGIVHHDKQSNKVIGFSQNLVGDYIDKENYHDFLINGGFMVFNKEVLNEIKPESMIEEIFIPMAKQGKLSLYQHPGKWKAMDTYKDVEELNEFWQSDPFWKVWENR